MDQRINGSLVLIGGNGGVVYLTPPNSGGNVNIQLPGTVPQVGQSLVATGLSNGMILTGWGSFPNFSAPQSHKFITAYDANSGTFATAQPSSFDLSDGSSLAQIHSQIFTGIPAAPTATPLTNSGQLATTGYADAAVAVERSRAISIESGLQNISQLGQPNGYASLNSGGQVPSSQIAALTVGQTFVVSSQGAQTSLSASVGAIAVRTDLNETFILQTAPASVFGNWVQLLSLPALVLSVNGQTGAVSLAASNLTNGTTGTGSIVLAVSPTFSGIPAVPTAPPLTSTTQIASTAYSDAAVSVEQSRALAAEALLAPQASPTLINAILTTPKTTAYTVGALPVGVVGQLAFASNGRKIGEGAGVGTGVPVYFSNGQWRVFSTDAAVLA